MSREPGDLPGKAEWPLSAQGAPQVEPFPDPRGTGPFRRRTPNAERRRSSGGERGDSLDKRSRSPVVARLAGGSALLAGVAAALIVTAAAVGPYAIPLSHTAGILLEQLGVRILEATDAERGHRRDDQCRASPWR
ncbi:hypothetical protein GBAR_LOCUS28490 [Geodia barretti]|uniref:Uncharacterized protein n=1 Tax=Geodia barretti TaxID=519541 RepID=A0AA35TPI4_GEOBA|nr:hypothetical protein GBAR_LOCUS28490 [Geodia barretti]